MSKNVLVLVGLAVAAVYFSSRDGSVQAGPSGVEGEFRGWPARQQVELNYRRYELIGMESDSADRHAQGTSVFVLDHETGNVIRHSFGSGTQRGQVVVSAVEHR